MKSAFKNTVKMSHDVVADALNMIKNAKKAGKENVEVKIISNLLIEVLKIMKQEKAIKKYKIDAQKKSILQDFSKEDIFFCIFLFDLYHN